MEEHAAGRLSVVQQVHGQQAPTRGAVHLSCPPLQAGKQGHAKACAPGSPSPHPAPSVPAPQFPCTIRTIRELVTCKNHPSPGGHTHTLCPLAALSAHHVQRPPIIIPYHLERMQCRASIWGPRRVPVPLPVCPLLKVLLHVSYDCTLFVRHQAGYGVHCSHCHPRYTNTLSKELPHTHTHTRWEPRDKNEARKAVERKLLRNSRAVLDVFRSVGRE